MSDELFPEMRQFLAGLSPGNGYSDNTRQSYHYDLKRCTEFLRSWEGPRYSRVSLEAFLESERHSGASSRTLARRLVVLRRFVNYLAVTRRISTDFGKELRTDNPEGADDCDRVTAPPLADGEIETVRLVLAGQRGPRGLRDSALFECLLDSGGRVATILDLNLADVERMDCGATAHTAIQSYLREGRPELVQEGKAGPALFVSQMGRRMTRQAVWMMLKMLGKSAGLGAGLSPRRLRHTAIIQMLAQGLPNEEMQARLGYRVPVSLQLMLARLEN